MGLGRLTFIALEWTIPIIIFDQIYTYIYTIGWAISTHAISYDSLCLKPFIVFFFFFSLSLLLLVILFIRNVCISIRCFVMAVNRLYCFESSSHQTHRNDFQLDFANKLLIDCLIDCFYFFFFLFFCISFFVSLFSARLIWGHVWIDIM